MLKIAGTYHESLKYIIGKHQIWREKTETESTEELFNSQK